MYRRRCHIRKQVLSRIGLLAKLPVRTARRKCTLEMDGYPNQGSGENQGTCELSTHSQTLGPLLGSAKIPVM